MANSILRLITAVLATIASAAAFAGDFYTVNVELAHNERVFSAPTLIVVAREESTISVASGDFGYKMKVTVIPDPSGQIKLVTKIETPHGVIEPTFVFREGDDVTFSTDQLRGKFVVSRNKT
jgi:exopolysaccharide biosynthesis predicted pyruvyltransferase EpsI